MATSLLSTGRIVLSYTVSGKTHRFRVYVRGLTFVSPNWMINSRAADANDTNWEDAAHDLQQTASYLVATETTWADAELHQYTGGVWLVRATKTLSITDHASSSAGTGWCQMVVLRDLNFKKVKVEILEGNVGTLSHTASYGALTGASLNFVKEFTSNRTLTNAPYNWMVGRGNQFLNPSSFVGQTVSPNRRVRRVRGLT